MRKVPARVRALGPIGLEAGGKLHALGTGQAGRVLAVLAADANVVVTSDRLIDAVWGWQPPKSARNALQVQIHRLRSLLTSATTSIETVAHGYRLVADAGSLDLIAFEQELRRARALRGSDLRGALTAAHSALELWEGEPFGGLADELGLDAEAVRLSEARLDVEELVSELELALGEVDIPSLHLLVEQHPERERRWADLVTALARCGRRSEALTTYRRAVRQLADEVGVEPSALLLAAEDEVLRWEAAGRPVRVVPLLTSSVDLIGRRREVEALADWITKQRWVTVTGLGGMGKSQVASAASQRASNAFADGVDVIHVHASSSIHQLAGAAATRLDQAPTLNGTGLETLANAVRERHLLLFIDGAEHRAEEISEAIEALLRECPRLHVVATSRVPLGGADEHLWPLGPLDDPCESVALFELAARRVRPGLEIGDDDRSLVDRICRLVGGIPLLIELAASQLTAQTLTSIADRLAREPFAGDPSGGRTAIAWSIDRLGDRELTAALGLAAFEGGWNRSSAERIIRALGADDDAIADVVQLGIARFDTESGRGEVLDPVREALAARHPTRFQEARHAHADDHLATASDELDRLLAVDRRGSLELLDAELDNFVAATAWASDRRDLRAIPAGAALAMHAWRRGRPGDGSAIFAELEERFRPLARHHPVGALTSAHVAMWTGQPALALARLDDAEGHLDRDDPGIVARLWLVRGNVIGWGLGRASDSLRWLRAAHELQAALGSPAAASSAVMEGYLAVRCGELGRVEEIERILDRSDDVRASFWPIGIDVVSGARAAYFGDPDLAELRLGAACEALDRIGLGVLKSPTYIPLVWSAALAGRPDLARERAETAYTANRDVSGGWRIGEACVAYGLAEICAGELEAAAGWFERALLAARRAPEADTVAWAASGLVECGHWTNGARRREAAIAAASLRAGLRLAVPVGADRLLPFALSVVADPAPSVTTDDVVASVREVVHVPVR